MKYLLDINVLIALALVEHQFHDRVSAWIRAERSSSFATCSITEIGFVRVVAQVPMYGCSVADAKTLLQRVIVSRVTSFEFLEDRSRLAGLPTWVRSPNHVTDGHLAQLARDHDAVFATLDEKIPGAYLIPERRGGTRR